MSRDGAGNYTLPSGNPVTTNTPISSTTHNNTMNDVAAALTSSLAKDGQTVPTNNLPMGGFKHTGVANGVAATDYAALGQVQSGAALVAAAAGTADALTGAFAPVVTALTAGLTLIVRAGSANATTTPTFKADGTAAKTIVKGNNLPLVVGDIAGAGHWLELTYDTTLGVWVLDNPANQVSTALQATSINGGPLAGLRNRIINGGMAVDQRNAGAAQTFTAAAALAYCVDRWYGYCTGANVTGQRVAGSNASQYRYQFTGAASVTAIGFGQRIEQLNSYDLNNRTATLGIDLANSLLTTVAWTAYYANTADTFGTLASPTRTQIATGTFTVSSTVTRYYAQIAIPAAATTGIEIVLSVGAQTSGTWTIGEAQLVPGSANEAWREQRPIGTELELCQRRCYIPNGAFNVAGYSTAGNSIYTWYALPVAMAALPTITASWGTLTNATGGSFRMGDTRTAESSIIVTGTGAASGVVTWTKFESEL